MTTWYHEERLRAVAAVVQDSRARRVLDLGCGDGDMFLRLAARPDLSELLGVDICNASLTRLHSRLARSERRAGSIAIRHGSMTEPTPDMVGFDCAILVETIEHIDPDRLSTLERALFCIMRPLTVVITTPNAEFNGLLGVATHRMRHPDHRFEWDRPTFRRWCRRAAQIAGYGVRITDIAGAHPALGGASQMAVFERAPDPGGQPERPAER